MHPLGCSRWRGRQRLLRCCCYWLQQMLKPHHVLLDWAVPAPQACCLAGEGHSCLLHCRCCC